MSYYLSNSVLFRSFFIIANIAIIYALYLSQIALIFKLIIFVIVTFWHYKAFLVNNFIRAFHLTICNNNLTKNKSILLTKNNEEIKAKFIEVSYFNTWLVILYFKSRSKNFLVPVFRDAVSLEQFKSLQLLARYNFLP